MVGTTTLEVVGEPAGAKPNQEGGPKEETQPETSGT